ncbi:chemotaxis protein CheW [Massilia sp. CF038]|uniref:chemotaxis protein CheW n=1 Tax=Massilia sp. CF038 TaxID=1881045 RepID=UPI00091F9D81|nr:chemotaxis protein CheW [Massilia sp. CF038]SHG62620.1 purine-binding chemotaxis protein CheW [Massilia sp. CF038]
MQTTTQTADTILEFLSFRLGAEEYGVDIQQVQELRPYTAVTSIANCPDHVKGVIHLRGVIVPIIDLRIKFKLPDPVYDQFTVVVILVVNGAQIGVVVDSVSEVLALTPDQIKPVPAISAGSYAEFVTGIGTLDQRMLILVDIAQPVAGADAVDLDSLAA